MVHEAPLDFNHILGANAASAPTDECADRREMSLPLRQMWSTKFCQPMP
jgi:hypothetical protein